jgi:hypothetical protein
MLTFPLKTQQSATIKHASTDKTRASFVLPDLKERFDPRHPLQHPPRVHNKS